MPRPTSRYVALVSGWDHEWDVYVLDPAAGLVGVTHATTLRGVRQAARNLLSDRLHEPADHFGITVLHPARLRRGSSPPGAPADPPR